MLDVVERFLKEVSRRGDVLHAGDEGFRRVRLTEAPRGSLMHFTVRNGKIDNYQIVSATLELRSRNDTGMRGALEEALIGVPVPDIENPVIARLIRAFDP